MQDGKSTKTNSLTIALRLSSYTLEESSNNACFFGRRQWCTHPFSCCLLFTDPYLLYQKNYIDKPSYVFFLPNNGHKVSYYMTTIAKCCTFVLSGFGDLPSFIHTSFIHTSFIHTSFIHNYYNFFLRCHYGF